MAKTVKLRMCEVCQQLAHITDFDKFLEAVKNCKAVEKYAYIIHDKDKDEKGQLKEEHIHIMVKFAYSYDINSFAKQLGIKAQYIQKIQSRNFEDGLLYLTHANSTEKYQYSTDAVTANFDYQSVCKNFQQKKEAVEKCTSEKELIKQYCDDIIEGKIKRYNYFQLIDKDLCVRYHSRFENAFKVRDDILRTQERSLEVIYMTGESGTGKTTLAKRIAKQKGYSYFVSSASNDVLDSYAGQDCLILDDLRPSCLSLSDLLKLLDNNTSSTAKSRYYNKILECKLIIITTVINIEEFFKNVFQEQEEPLIQLKRRCSTYFEVHKRNIRVSMYDSTKQDYVYVETIQNPIMTLYPSAPLSGRTAEEKLKDFLGEDYQIDNREDWLVTDEESPFDSLPMP